jgi:2-iminobutanoate/2-iminopropanoate deaminase
MDSFPKNLATPCCNIRNKFINVNHAPASTLLQVSKLFRDGILVEIEATTVIPKKP